jgi:hypothetical protein
MINGLLGREGHRDALIGLERGFAPPLSEAPALPADHLKPDFGHVSALARRILVQATHNLVVDGFLGDQAQWGLGQPCLPGGEVVAVAEIGVEEMPAGAPQSLVRQ